MSQMTKVNCQYGAPMGRRSYGKAQDCAPRTIRLFRMNLDGGGYDDGGAYWGAGEPIYCATDNADYFETVRASNRDHACLLLGLDYASLKNSIKRPAWLRYSAERAYIGKPLPVWLISEFGQPVGYVYDWVELCHFAQTCQYAQGSTTKRGEGLHLFKKD